MKNPKIARVI